MNCTRCKAYLVTLDLFFKVIRGKQYPLCISCYDKVDAILRNSGKFMTYNRKPEREVKRYE